MKTDDAGAGAQTPPISLAVFARRSPGIVREFSLWDAAWYGILAGGLLYSLYYVFPTMTVTLPGLNPPLGYALALIGLVPVVAVPAGAPQVLGGLGLGHAASTRPAVQAGEAEVVLRILTLRR